MFLIGTWKNYPLMGMTHVSVHIFLDPVINPRLVSFRSQWYEVYIIYLENLDSKLVGIPSFPLKYLGV